MKLDELLPVIPLNTLIVFRNTLSYKESEPETLEALLHLDFFLKDSGDYEVERIRPLAAERLRIDIVYSKEENKDVTIKKKHRAQGY